MKPKRFHLAIGRLRVALNFPGVRAHDQVASVLTTGIVRYQSIASIEKAYPVLVIRPFGLFSAAGLSIVKGNAEWLISSSLLFR